MLLKDVLDSLRFGELSTMSIGGEEQGKITKKNFTNVCTHINAGLVSLYTRFKLKEGVGTVPLVADQTKYALTFPDLLKVTQIALIGGREFTLNNLADPDSIMFRTAKEIDVPAPVVEAGGELRVVYRAKHPTIDSSPFTIMEEEDIVLELPYSYLEALTYYVASRLSNPLDMTGQFHSGNNYAAKYEKECQRLELDNVYIDGDSQSTRFNSNGWV